MTGWIIIIVIIVLLIFFASSKKNSFQISTKSHSSKNTRYTLDEKEASCTCPDFKKRRKSYQIGDPRRLCKHLIRAYVRGDILLHDDFQIFDPHLQELEEKNWGYPLNSKIISRRLRDDKNRIVYIIPTGNYPWARIFIENYDTQFLYHVKEKRWAYKNTPPFSDECAKIISKHKIQNII